MQEYVVKVYKTRTEWYQNGELHREDGPAIEHFDGTKVWCRNGFLHREDGPAIECTSGYKAWYQNGERHREDGPAITYSDGDKSWFLNNRKVTEVDVMGQSQSCENKTVIVDGIKYRLTKV